MPHRHSLGLLLLRLPIAITFLLAGINKLRGGLAHFVEQASPTIPHFLPTPLGQAYLHALPFAEAFVGLLLLLGLFTRTTAAVASLMLLSFMIAVTGFTAQGPSLHTNVVFLGVTLALLFTGPGTLSLDHTLLHKHPAPTAV